LEAREGGLYELGGKVALVTGAGGQNGIGRAVATRLAREGADVAVNDLRDEPTGNWGGLSQVVSEIEALGRGSLGCVGDVSNSADVARMIAATLERFGRIDILVNNAGSQAGPDRVQVVDLDEAVWDRVQAVNAKGTFLVSQAVARHMIARGGGGKIVNLSSSAGKEGRARFAAYSASKFAIIGFTQSLALELAEHRINVNAICPGLVDTERVYGMASGLKPENVTTEAHHDVLIEEGASANPFGRVAQADDIAQAAAYLASAESDYMTGLAISVSGGMIMH
jgi:meso-butanediol dehydrogenase / (S,S)-butanediol dehydrogenase / diacetyl reductase